MCPSLRDDGGERNRQVREAVLQQGEVGEHVAVAGAEVEHKGSAAMLEARRSLSPVVSQWPMARLTARRSQPNEMKPLARTAPMAPRAQIPSPPPPPPLSTRTGHIKGITPTPSHPVIIEYPELAFIAAEIPMGFATVCWKPGMCKVFQVGLLSTSCDCNVQRCDGD